MLTNYEDKKKAEQGTTSKREQLNTQAKNSARFLKNYCDNTACRHCIFSVGHITSEEDPIVYDCTIAEPYCWNIV